METLNESSLARLWSKTQAHEAAMISAFRGGMSKTENRQRSAKMAAALRKLGYSVTQIQGAYVEKDEDGKPREVRELSFFVANQKDADRFADTIFKLGAKFDQDSVALIPKGGKGAYLIGTNKTGFLGYRQKETIGGASWGTVTGAYFSRVGGRPFEFKTAKVADLNERIESRTAMGFLVESRYADEVLGAIADMEGLDEA